MTRKQLILVVSLVVVLMIGLLLYANRQGILARFFSPTESSITNNEVDPEKVQSIVTGLVTPWSISFLPSGDMLVSERSGQLKRIGESGAEYVIDNVRETSEGGLLGIALHPEFETNNRLYLYYTTEQSGQLTNQIDMAQLQADSLVGQETVLADIPAAANHNGGAIEFGPDDKLYVTTGDAAQANLAQDKNSLAGKILRINPDGSAPDDNPFGNLVWSHGHRNPQGLTWDNEGQLWSVEHGPSGPETGRDELNLIEKAANYGWPEITGDESHAGMVKPVLQSGSDETWAPARMVFADDKLYFTGLRGQSLYQVDIGQDKPKITKYFSSDYGRLRAIATHGGRLYIGTSNRDGRGSVRDGDDRILRVPLSILEGN